jgi:two-component system, OmpR family, response regulator MprA
MSQDPETLSFEFSETASHTKGKDLARVLLAEDDRAVRRYLQVILERAGYEVICAGDGLEAMKIALAEPLDAVITDAIMPHLTGQELCRFLRSYPTLATLPVILLSAFENNTAPAGTEAVANVCLVKPVKPEELTATLARLISENSRA